MNRRSVLTMIEQVIAVLAFAVAAAVCLKVFAFSAELSDETRDISEACIMLQNAAEALKNSGGDYALAAEKTGMRFAGGYLECSEDGYELKARAVSSGNDGDSDGLKETLMTVSRGGEEICSLTLLTREGGA